jgi:ParB family transcriptional regulator, chromosome partitioning protein
LRGSKCLGGSVVSNLELKGLRLLRNIEASLPDSNEKDNANLNISYLALEFLMPCKYQPRKHIDDAILNELADSIKVQGIIQPLIVRKKSYGKYEIIAGERRWRAATIVGLTHVPAIVRDIEDNVALAFSLIENIQRENLNPVEEAVAFSKFSDAFSMTHDDIAHMLGRSRVSVTNTLRLLSLESRVMQMLGERKIDMGHARALLTLDPEQQYRVALIIVEKQLNVRAAEELANSLKFQKDRPSDIKTNYYHEKCENWTRELSSKFSTKVSVKLTMQGKGTITIHVNSADEVERLIGLNELE